MPTLNEQLLDLSIRHAVGLQRLSAGTVRRVIALLNQVDADLVAQIQKRAGVDNFTTTRLNTLLTEIRKINRTAYVALEKALRGEMSDLAVYERDFQKRLLQATLPIEFSIVTPPVKQLVAATLARPFQGRLLTEWVEGLEAGRYDRLRGAIRMGFVEGETVDQMVRRIRGTSSLGFKDGILDISRRSATAIVRTAISHTANYSRNLLYEQNKDIIKGWRFTATLDTRTSEICASLDGKVFPIGEGPFPPRHPNCRSVSTPLTRSWRELGLDIDDVPPGTRASMNGQVPSGETYNSWLKKQSAAVQDEALGPTRGALFRRGDISVDKFADDNRTFTLDELKRREADAFAKAGLGA